MPEELISRIKGRVQMWLRQILLFWDYVKKRVQWLFFASLHQMGLKVDPLVADPHPFMIGQELGVVALYDTDRAGNTAKDKLVKSWLARYKDAKALPLSLGETVGVSDGDFGIEDIFPEEFYLNHVKDCYKAQLAAAQIKKITLSKGGMLCKRVERFFKDNDLPAFNKGSVAKKIRVAIKEMTSIENLPEETRERTVLLFKAVNRFFEKKKKKA